MFYLDDSLTEEELRDAAQEQRDSAFREQVRARHPLALAATERNQDRAAAERSRGQELREVPFEFTARMNDHLKLLIRGVRFQV
jgi:hypothetical protein